MGGKTTTLMQDSDPVPPQIRISESKGREDVHQIIVHKLASEEVYPQICRALNLPEEEVNPLVMAEALNAVVFRYPDTEMLELFSQWNSAARNHGAAALAWWYLEQCRNVDQAKTEALLT